MSSSYAVLPLLLLLPLSSALKSPQALPTDESADRSGILSGFVPLPTRAPDASWRFGYEPKHALFARQETRTCGYFNADPNQPNVCGPSSQCYFATSDYYFGCCANSDDCPNPPACSTYNGGNIAGPQLNDAGDVQCGSEAPECQTTVFPTVNGLDDTGPYTHFDCVVSAGDVLTLFQETAGGSTTNGNDAGTTQTVTRTRTESSDDDDGDDTVTVTQTQTQTQAGATVSVIVPLPATSASTTSSDTSSTTTESSGSESAGILNSAGVNPTSSDGGAAQQTAAAGAGLMFLALAAGRVLL